MFNDVEKFKLLASFQGVSKPYSSVKNKKHNTFSIRTAGSAIHIFEDKSILTNEGDMLFLPKGISYEFKTVSKTECRYTSLNFDAELIDAKPTLYSLENFSETNFLYNNFTNCWRFGNQSEKFKCISIFYGILSYVSNIENTNYADKKKYKIIEPAIDYLKSHLYDPNLKVDNLHLLCGISDTYFRKIFISNFGTTPLKYIVGKRISHAKSLLDNEEFDSISELATLVGYKDPLYFSRAFKNKYGVCPSNINK